MSAQFTAASNNYLEQVGAPVSAYPYCHVMKIRFVDGASIPNADLAGFGDITSGGADYEYHQIQSRASGEHARFERANDNGFVAATVIGGFGGGAYDHAVSEARHVIEWVTVIVNAAAANDIKMYAAKTLDDIAATEATDTNSQTFPADFNGANGRFRVGRGSFSGATSDANFYCAEHAVLNRVMTAAEMVDYHNGLKLTKIPTIAADLTAVKYYASYASAVTAEIGTNMSNVSTVTFDADIHPHTISYTPLHWTEVPRAFTKTDQKEAFRALFYDDFARIAVFGDSTGVESGGSGNWECAARRDLWGQIRGHKPATPPMFPNTSFALPSADEGAGSNEQEFDLLAHGFSVDASALSGEYAASELPPGFSSTNIRKLGLDTNGPFVGGQGFWLHINHANEQTNVFPERAGTGNAAYAAGTMSLGRSQIDAASGLRLKVVCLTFTGSTEDVYWSRIRLATFASPPDSGQSDDSGILFGGAETLDAAPGTCRVASSDLLNELETDAAWYYFHIAGNEEAAAKAIIFSAQVVSDNQTGIDWWNFAASGYHTSSIVLDDDGTTTHADMWFILNEIGFDAYWITLGTNDELHPAIYDYYRRELIDHIRTESGDAAAPITLEAHVYQASTHSSGSFSETRDYHAGVDYQIAQDTDDVFFLNTRRISEEQFNFEANAATYLQDDVHRKRAGAIVVAKSAVWGTAQYFNVANGFGGGISGARGIATWIIPLINKRKRKRKRSMA